MLATQQQIQLIWTAEPYSCNTNNINLRMFQILHCHLTFAIWAESVAPKKGPPMQRHSLTIKRKNREAQTFSIEIAVTILFAVTLCSTNFSLQ